LFSLDIIRQHQQQGQQQQQQQEQEAQLPSSVVLITNPFHQLRSYYTFLKAAQQAGLDIKVSASATAFSRGAAFCLAVSTAQFVLLYPLRHCLAVSIAMLTSRTAGR
jgi:uncharacterized SAM-binding protein YcdF (DUF218 family)